MFACSIYDKKKHKMIGLISFSGECVALLDFSTSSIKIIFTGTIRDPARRDINITSGSGI